MYNFFENSFGYHFGGILASISILADIKGVAEIVLIFASATGVLWNAYTNHKKKK